LTPKSGKIQKGVYYSFSLLSFEEWAVPLFCFVMDRVEDKVYELAAQVARNLGFDLEGVELLGRGRKTLLRIVIDKEGGITLDDCEAFSKDIEALLDVEDPIEGSYTLEVSSPGLDRPLKNLRDFKKHMGKLVRVVTKEKVDGQSFFIGRIAGVEEDHVKLSLKNKQIEIFFDNISKAKLEIEIK
jgi:ribosome maturation factor RimP